MASDWRKGTRSKPNDGNGESSRGKLYLEGMNFLLEVEDRQLRTKVAEAIRSLGGHVLDSFDEHEPFAVISDHSFAQKLEKEKETRNTNEKIVKTLPALLREAVKRNIKVRTPQKFLAQLTNYQDKRKKTCSATNSDSTIRRRPLVGRERSAQAERTTQTPVPKTSRVSSEQTNHRTKDEKAFLRIDLPGKRPDIRFVDKTAFSTLYTGKDTGHSIFKGADSSLSERRIRDFDMFMQGKYEPSKKTYKLDEPDPYCIPCAKNITGEKKDHERTDEHRQKARINNTAPSYERALLTARLRTDQRDGFEKRKEGVARERQGIRDASKRANVEFEYGENELKANWATLQRNTPMVTPEKEPRRRQRRIRYSPSQGDGPAL